MNRRAAWALISILVLVAGAALGSVHSFFGGGKALAGEIAACAGEGARKQACYQRLVEVTSAEKGIAAGLDALALLYETDQEFAAYCHGTTHEIGKAAYAEFRDDGGFSINPKTSYCGFGFYHGFLEAMLHEEGDLDRATEFCEYVDGQLFGEINGVSFACYHGIGHGVVDGSDPALWNDVHAFIGPGLALCASLPTDVLEHKTRCASGVFNALAIAYVDERYDLGPDPEDPYAICRTQDVPYARKACYDQMNGYVNMSSADFREALTTALATAEESYRELAVETTAGYRVLDAVKGMRPLSAYIEDCSVLPDPYAQLCVRGFSSSLIEHGKPGKEYDDALRACLESGTMRDVCVRGVTISVYDRLPPDMRDTFCADIARRIDKAHADECTAYMSSTRQL